MSELSREQVEALSVRLFGILAWEPGPNQTCDDYADTVATFIAPTVAVMLTEARAEVARDVEAVTRVLPHGVGCSIRVVRGVPCDCWIAEMQEAVVARYMPAAVREGGTERSRDVQRPDGPQESAGPSGGRTGPGECGDVSPDGRMVCHMRAGHDGWHEDWTQA